MTDPDFKVGEVHYGIRAHHVNRLDLETMLDQHPDVFTKGTAKDKPFCIDASLYGGRGIVCRDGRVSLLSFPSTLNLFQALGTIRAMLIDAPHEVEKRKRSDEDDNEDDDASPKRRGRGRRRRHH